MARKTQGERIDDLEMQAATLARQFDAYVIQLNALTELHAKGSEATSGMTVKIAVIEERLVVLDLKGALGKLTALEAELALLRKDLTGLQAWKDELRREKEEAMRRLWSFGPNISAAVIGGLISLGTALLVLWLNKLR
ncbi:MAG: hypothetical protein K2R98_16320 [Gemmataceae bacterium]|nr:hypothetical protein [Gemmataceae bacterium]